MLVSTTRQRLAIYSSQDFLPSGIPHVTLLYPFWGLPESEHTPGIYTQFIGTGNDYFQMVPAKDADFLVLPFDWRYATRPAAKTEQDASKARTAAQRISDWASDLGKRLVVFYVGDTDEEVPFPNTLVFRTSLSRGLRSNEFAMTVFFEDFVGQRLGRYLPLRPRLKNPSIGFCGFAGYRLMPKVGVWKRARRTARWARDGIPAPTTRERAMVILQQHPSIITEFILREHGVGRAQYAQPDRDAFYRNLIDTDYTLCARGSGNWSIRFYETLACARIPLFIDTECVLPYDFETNYGDCCVWVDRDQLEDVAERLVEFHDGLNDADFIELQRACRRIWEHRLTPEGFFSNFHKHFETP